jgi:hypothetical protein
MDPVPGGRARRVQASARSLHDETLQAAKSYCGKRQLRPQSLTRSGPGSTAYSSDSGSQSCGCCRRNINRNQGARPGRPRHSGMPGSLAVHNTAVSVCPSPHCFPGRILRYGPRALTALAAGLGPRRLDTAKGPALRWVILGPGPASGTFGWHVMVDHEGFYAERCFFTGWRGRGPAPSKISSTFQSRMLPFPETPPRLPMRRHGFAKPPPNLCVARESKPLTLMPSDGFPAAQALNIQDLMEKSKVAASQYFSKRFSDIGEYDHENLATLSDHGEKNNKCSHGGTLHLEPMVSSEVLRTRVAQEQSEESKCMYHICKRELPQSKVDVIQITSVQGLALFEIPDHNAARAVQD